MTAWVDGPVLGIETSGRLTGLALAQRGKLLSESSIDLHASTQELLPSLLQSMLERFGWRLRDLQRIGVALGPGSFTGLRVGLAWARALSLGSDVPLVGVGSHAALAYSAREAEAQILLLTGLRRGLLSLELGEWRESHWHRRLPGRSCPAESWSREVEPHLAADRPLFFLGEAVESALAADERLRSRGQVWPDPLAAQRRPAPIALLASQVEAEEHRGDGLDRLQIQYLRDADAKKPQS